jgi:hypothetical protein
MPEPSMLRSGILKEVGVKKLKTKTRVDVEKEPERALHGRGCHERKSDLFPPDTSTV